MADPVLEVRDLSVEFPRPAGGVLAAGRGVRLSWACWASPAAASRRPLWQ